jgi:hypothetical protein
MAVESRLDLTNYPFFLSGRLIHRDNETVKQDAGRTTPLKRYTLMAQVAATGKWVPLTDVAALDGSNTARGIYVGDDISAAALVAGDVTACPIVVGGDLSTFDGAQLVLENSLTLASVCSDDPAGADNGAVNVRRISDDLARIGLYAESAVDIENFENAD